MPESQVALKAAILSSSAFARPCIGGVIQLKADTKLMLFWLRKPRELTQVFFDLHAFFLTWATLSDAGVPRNNEHQERTYAE